MSDHGIVAFEVWDAVDTLNQTNNIVENMTDRFNSEYEITNDDIPNCEYVNAVVFNEDGEALIIEFETSKAPMGKWAMLETTITEMDDPLTAVKTALLEKTGYNAKRWHYIGTYLKNGHDMNGAGHVFVAHAAQKQAEPICNDKDKFSAKWVPVKELRYGLLDGRILSVRYALNVALALLTATE